MSIRRFLGRKKNNQSEMNPGQLGMPPLDKKKVIKEVRSILIIVTLLFAGRSILFEPFRIPSGSMIPTLMIGDFIWVNKFAYGFKIPFSDMYGDPIYLFRNQGPKRGDVVVFKFPRDENINYIKRVVGLPGDQIEVVDKVLYINRESLKEVELPSSEGGILKSRLEKKFKIYNLRFFDSKTGEHEHKIITSDDRYHADSYSAITIPEGKYFVMGDNRDFSSDSREWGFVDQRLVKGRALFVWFSLNPPHSEMGHEFKFRPWRIGKSIH